MRVLAKGEDKEFRKYPKLLKEKFVFLNEYTTSVQAEHDPRGPDGPYQFKDRSVPVVVFKKWDGETLIQQLGFTPDPKQGPPALARLVDKAIKENGPVAPPKALRPLLKSMDSAKAALEKKKTGQAIRELLKVIKAGSDPKKFKDGKPQVALDAERMLDELRVDAEARLDEIAELAIDDPKAAEKQYRALLRDYAALPEIKKAINEALKGL